MVEGDLVEDGVRAELGGDATGGLGGEVGGEEVAVAHPGALETFDAEFSGGAEEVVCFGVVDRGPTEDLDAPSVGEGGRYGVHRCDTLV